MRAKMQNVYPHPTLGGLWCKEEEEKEAAMADNTYYNSEAYVKRDHLIRRLRDIYWEKARDNENLFGLRDDDPPENGSEFVLRIKSGQYMLQKFNPEDVDSEDYIRWRDPAKKVDREGHRAFLKKLDETFAGAKDKIMVLDEAKGLEALNEFKAFVG